MIPRGGIPSVERVVLRAAIGAENMPDVERIGDALDALRSRGIISESGLGAVLALIADEIVTCRVLAEFGPDLLAAAHSNDTRPPEDPTT